MLVEMIDPGSSKVLRNVNQQETGKTGRPINRLVERYIDKLRKPNFRKQNGQQP